MNDKIEKLKFLNKRSKIGSLCCAPFTSIYFGHRGIVSACCANRTKILGIYPEKSLDEIWNGKEFKEMRNELESFKFSAGCDQCKRLLNSGNYSSLKIPLHDVIPKNYKDLKYPNQIHFELDNKCNLMCLMCHGKFSSKILKYREKKPKYKSPYLSNNFFREIKPFLKNAEKIDFYGGEPFLINIYLKILDYLKINNPDANVYIQTNGTIASKKVLDFIRDLKINLSISMDSVKKDTYEKIRVGANYEQVVKNIEAFYKIIKNNNRQLYLSAVLCNLNYNELVEFYYFCSQFNMKLYFHDLTAPRELSVYVLDREELSNNLYILKDKISNIKPSTETDEYNLDVIKSQITHLEYVLKNIISINKNNNFSISIFLEKNFPDLAYMYNKKLKEHGITDETLSSSITFASMQEHPESFLYKKIIKSTDDQIEKDLEQFIKDEKSMLNRKNT